jgi:hypothetical protein
MIEPRFIRFGGIKDENEGFLQLKYKSSFKTKQCLKIISKLHGEIY